MSDRAFPAFVVLIVVLAGISLVSIAMEASKCWSNDGAMVQGISWNGMVCVDKNE